MPTFKQVYDLLKLKGPGHANPAGELFIGLKLATERLLHFQDAGRVTIHQDCWGENITCQWTRTGGIYNGPYSIYDWYNDNSTSPINS